MVNKNICLIFGIVLLLSVVSAWSVEITNPENNSFWNEDKGNILFDSTYYTFNWEIKGILLSNINPLNPFYLNNNLIGTFSNLSNPISRDIISGSFNEGYNNLTIIVENNTGYKKINSSIFFLDDIKPNITLTQPNNLLYYTNQNSINLSAYIIEKNIAYYDEDKELFLKIASHNGTKTNHTLENNSYYQLDLTVDGDGYYNYSFFAKDRFPGNSTNHEVNITGTIIRDTTKPTISIDSPQNNTLQKREFFIDISSDGGLSPISNITLDISNNTNSVDFSFKEDSNLYNYSWDSTNSLEGQYNITARAWDKAGNENMTWILVNIDNTAPQINISSPINGSINTTGEIFFNITADDYSTIDSCWYSIDGGLNNNSLESSSSYYNYTNQSFTKQGWTNLSVWCNDSVGNLGLNNSIIFNVDTIKPTINLISPENKAYNSITQLNYTYSDANPGFCWYSNDLGLTNSSPVNAGTNFTGMITNEGLNNWTIFCNDSAGNENLDIIYFTIDTIAPSVNIDYPINTTYTSPITQLNYTYSDANPGFCWYSNDLGLTNSSPVNAGTNFTGMITNEGLNNWTIFCNDSAGNENLDIIYFTIDTTPPTINLLTPNNSVAFAFDNNNITFNFVSNDASGISDCSIYLNGSLNQNGNKSIFTINNTAQGLNSWYINCTDNSGLYNTSEIRQFTILSELTNESEFTNYTNLTETNNISNVLFFFVENEFGKINWTEFIDFSSGFDWTQCVNISPNRIEVDSLMCPELNKSAIIQFNNLSWTTPKVLKDGLKICEGSACPNYNYTNGTLILSVDGFSVYTTDEHDIVNTPSSSSGGGGGGSSTYYKCVEWGEWSGCIDNLQKRICDVKEKTTYSQSESLTQTQTCVVEVEIPEESNEDDNETQTNSTDTSGHGFTAGVIGAMSSGKGLLALIFVGFVAVGAIGVTLYRRYR